MTTPGPVAPSEPHDVIAQRAAVFFQRRRFWTWSDADQAELDAWIAESDFHQVAWLRLEGSIAHVDKLAALRPPRLDVPRAGGARRRFVLPLLVAASIVVVATLAIPFVRDLMQPPDRVFATNVGGRALLKFADGTQIELNTDTAVRYRMTTQERTVWLDKGEAYFRVAHNAANPFAVVAEGRRITDLGTEFLVRHDAGSLDIALVKGRAQLASENSGVSIAMLAPGDEAVATPTSTTIVKKTQKQLADELGWQRGVLVFRNTTLADAVREFNRYNEIKLVIADPSIAGLKFSAEIKTDHYEDFLQLAQMVLRLRVDREGNDILISRGQREKTRRAADVKRSL
jgi:transmembrane sensor